MSESVQGAKTPYSGQSAGNAVGFIFDQKAKEIYTALPVTVQAVYKGTTTGYVDVLPLVGTYDGKKEYVPPTTLFHLPYCRIHGGAAALILDPVVGDKGLAIFCGQDVSGVTADITEPQQPASYRDHSMSDGYYIGGFLNQKPRVFVELEEGGVVNIDSNGGSVTINTGTCTINAPSGIAINGNVSVAGTITSTGDMVAGGISAQGHTHTGVHGETSSAH